MLLEHIAAEIRAQIDRLAERVANLEIDSHTPVDWKQLIDNMEERLRRLEEEVDSLS